MIMLSVLESKTFHFHWSSEIYGLGECFRRTARYPRILPLFFTSDHGVNISGYLDPDIKTRKVKTRKHITWSEENLHTNVAKLKIEGTQHPWLYYLEDNKEKLKENRSGSIFYPLHRAPGFIFHGLDDSESIKYLHNLPDQYQPVHVSIHMHDLGSEREKLFLSAGFKVVTLGETNDRKFHEKFFSLISGYRYAFSESWGSHIPFLIKCGIPTQIIPRRISILEASENKKVHSNEYEMELRQAEKIFSKSPTQITSDQIQYVDRVLGVKLRKRRLQLSVIAYGQLVKLGLPWMINLLIETVPRRIAKGKTRETKNKKGII